MKSEVEGLPDLHTFVKINNYVSRFSFPPMSFPKIAKALVPRAIPESKMWFNPLAPEPEETAPVEPKTEDSAAAVAAAPVSEDPKSKRDEQPATGGAPLKEAEGIVPKPELPKPEVPKVVVSVPQESPLTISHNL